MKNIVHSTVAMTALALLAPAAEPEAKPDAKPAAEVAKGDDAKQLEKKVIGYRTLDAGALLTFYVAKMRMPEGEGQAASSLKARAISPDPAEKKQELELLIKDQQITVTGDQASLSVVALKSPENHVACGNFQPKAGDATLIPPSSEQRTSAHPRGLAG